MSDTLSVPLWLALPAALRKESRRWRAADAADAAHREQKQGIFHTE
jgi:hypothetical protein